MHYDIYAPNYYRDFKCTADKCKHSCCINWEIPIDEKTLEKYRKSGDGIIDTVSLCDGEYCFKLKENGRCPHLNDKGLCNIIISHGDDYLADICKNHPRFFNDVGHGRREAGLGIVCEEACRLILECERPFNLEKIASTEDSADGEDIFNALPTRDIVIGISEKDGIGFNEKLKMIRGEFEIPRLYTQNEWLDFFSELEILDDGWENILKAAKEKPSFETNGKFDKYYSRLLTYFVFRHVSTADGEENLRARLAFSLLSSEMIKYLFEKEKEPAIEALLDMARRYSAEIEYSEDNTAEIIFEFESLL